MTSTVANHKPPQLTVVRSLTDEEKGDIVSEKVVDTEKMH